MQIHLYQIDSFTDSLFKGNPAAVCPLDKWIEDNTLQNIALENNLSETAFFVKKCRNYELRWFTPAYEVDLCGHATLATAHVLFHHLDYNDTEIVFETRSGLLTVKKSKYGYTMDLPIDDIHPASKPEGLFEALGIVKGEVWKGKSDFMVVKDSQEEVEKIKPDFNTLAKYDFRGIIITAKGNETDFVSRFFAPAAGINEDPVTGSAHTTLAPYWADRLDKKKLTARQVSKRGGNLVCELNDERILISGKAVTFMKGTINI